MKRLKKIALPEKGLEQIAVIAHEENYSVEDVLKVLGICAVELSEENIETIRQRRRELEELPKPVIGE